MHTKHALCPPVDNINHLLGVDTRHGGQPPGAMVPPKVMWNGHKGKYLNAFTILQLHTPTVGDCSPNVVFLACPRHPVNYSIVVTVV